MPDLGFGYSFSYGQPNHGVAKKVHDGTNKKNDPGRSDLVGETTDDADIAAQVLEETEQIEGGLVVA